MYADSDYVPGFGRYATWFATWTQLFFLLSGFVLAYAELAKPARKGGWIKGLLRYVRRRLTVIYPAFFMALHVFLLQSWLPLCQEEKGSVSCSPWLYNGEAWFLSVLIVYWFALRPLAEFFRRRTFLFSC